MAVGDPQPLDPAALEQIGFSERALRSRRSSPIPYRTGLYGLLEDASRMSTASNPAAVERAVGEFSQQWPFMESHGLARRGSLDVQVLKNLDQSKSRIMPIIQGDPKATAELNRLLDSVITSSRPVVAAEYKQVARQLKGMLPQLGYVMQLGAMSGIGIPRINFRESILQSLWLESFITVPNAAGLSSAQLDRRLAEQAAKVGIISRKGARGRLLGAPGPMVAEYLPIVQEILAPSIGLRSGRGAGQVLLRPDILSSESQTLGEPLSQARRNIREVEIEKSGISRRLATKDTELRARRMMNMFKENLSVNDQTRILSMIGERPETLNHAFRADPERTAVRLLATLRSSERDLQDLELPYGDRTRLADRIEEAVTSRRKAHGAVKTRMTKAVEEAGYVSEAEAMREIRKQARKVGKITGKPIGPGSLPFVLALASVIGAGMLAGGFSREEAA